MLTNWLAFTTFLAAAANQKTEAVTLATTCRVKADPKEEQILNCGHRQEEKGVVPFWHTPFGDILPTAFHSELDPVFMNHDGSLLVPRTTTLHSGLYYCLLQYSQGTTLWSYQLHVQNHSSRDAFRSRSYLRSEARKQDVVSHELFVGAVVASVLLTFLMGFSAGALSRTQVLRFVSTLTMRLRSLQKQTNCLDSEVAMTTPPPTLDNQMMRTTPPLSKPQRSFRSKRKEAEKSPAYLFSLIV